MAKEDEAEREAAAAAEEEEEEVEARRREKAARKEEAARRRAEATRREEAWRRREILERKREEEERERRRAAEAERREEELEWRRDAELRERMAAEEERRRERELEAQARAHAERFRETMMQEEEEEERRQWQQQQRERARRTGDDAPDPPEDSPDRRDRRHRHQREHQRQQHSKDHDPWEQEQQQQQQQRHHQQQHYHHGQWHEDHHHPRDDDAGRHPDHRHPRPQQRSHGDNDGTSAAQRQRGRPARKGPPPPLRITSPSSRASSAAASSNFVSPTSAASSFLSQTSAISSTPPSDFSPRSGPPSADSFFQAAAAADSSSFGSRLEDGGGGATTTTPNSTDGGSSTFRDGFGPRQRGGRAVAPRGSPPRREGRPAGSPPSTTSSRRQRREEDGHAVHRSQFHRDVLYLNHHQQQQQHHRRVHDDGRSNAGSNAGSNVGLNLGSNVGGMSNIGSFSEVPDFSPASTADSSGGNGPLSLLHPSFTSPPPPPPPPPVGTTTASPAASASLEASGAGGKDGGDDDGGASSPAFGDRHHPFNGPAFSGLGDDDGADGTFGTGGGNDDGDDDAGGSSPPAGPAGPAVESGTMEGGGSVGGDRSSASLAGGTPGEVGQTSRKQGDGDGNDGLASDGPSREAPESGRSSGMASGDGDSRGMSTLRGRLRVNTSPEEEESGTRADNDQLSSPPSRGPGGTTGSEGVSSKSYDGPQTPNRVGAPTESEEDGDVLTSLRSEIAKSHGVDPGAGITASSADEDEEDEDASPAKGGGPPGSPSSKASSSFSGSEALEWWKSMYASTQNDDVNQVVEQALSRHSSRHSPSKSRDGESTIATTETRESSSKKQVPLQRAVVPVADKGGYANYSAVDVAPEPPVAAPLAPPRALAVVAAVSSEDDDIFSGLDDDTPKAATAQSDPGVARDENEIAPVAGQMRANGEAGRSHTKVQSDVGGATLFTTDDVFAGVMTIAENDVGHQWGLPDDAKNDADHDKLRPPVTPETGPLSQTPMKSLLDNTSPESSRMTAGSSPADLGLHHKPLGAKLEEEELQAALHDGKVDANVAPGKGIGLDNTYSTLTFRTPKRNIHGIPEIPSNASPTVESVTSDITSSVIEPLGQHQSASQHPQTPAGGSAASPPSAIEEEEDEETEGDDNDEEATDKFDDGMGDPHALRSIPERGRLKNLRALGDDNSTTISGDLSSPRTGRGSRRGRRRSRDNGDEGDDGTSFASRTSGSMTRDSRASASRMTSVDDETMQTETVGEEDLTAFSSGDEDDEEDTTIREENGMEGQQTRSTLFSKLGCIILDTLANNVCAVQDGTLSPINNNTAALLSCGMNKDDANDRRMGNAEAEQMEEIHDDNVDENETLEEKPALALHESASAETPSMSASCTSETNTMNTLGSSVASATHMSLSEKERRVWDDWDRRDTESSMMTPIVAETNNDCHDTVTTGSVSRLEQLEERQRKAQHLERRARAHEKLLLYAYSALSVPPPPSAAIEKGDKPGEKATAIAGSRNGGSVQNKNKPPPPGHKTARSVTTEVSESRDESDIASNGDKVTTPAAKEAAVPVLRPPKVSHESKAPISSEQERRTLESFTSRLKNDGMEILKLNRDKKWQTKFLTVSKEIMWQKGAFPNGIDRGSCPQALLWVKKFHSKTREHSISAIDKQGKGGMYLPQMVGATESSVDDAAHPLSKKQSSGKFKDSVLVTLHSESGGNSRSVTIRCRSKADADFLCQGCNLIIDVLKRDTNTKAQANLTVEGPRA